MAGQPDISIIIPAYRAAATLPDAIQSCRAQTLSNIEVIVVDDASPEPLDGVVRTAASTDPRIQFYRLPENQGPSGARNLGLTYARGDFIAVLDADDTLMPDRLARLHGLARDSNADIVADNLISVQEGGSDPSPYPFLSLDPNQSPRSVRLLDLMRSGHGGPFSPSLGYLKPLFRRSFLERHGLTYDPGLRNSEDYFFLAEALVRGAEMMLCPQPGYVYRRHSASISYRIDPAEALRVASAERMFRQCHRASLSPAHRVASRRREVMMTRLAQFEEAVTRVRRGHWASALWGLLKHPTSLGFHLRKVIKVLNQRRG